MRWHCPRPAVLPAMVLVVALALMALSSSARAAAVDVSLSPEAGTARAPVSSPMTLGVRADSPVGGLPTHEPLVWEFPAEVRLGRTGDPGCTPEQLLVAAPGCPRGTRIGAGNLTLLTPAGALPVGLEAFTAPGGAGLNLLATLVDGAIPVRAVIPAVVGPGPSTLTVPWVEAIGALGGVGVSALDLRVYGTTDWVMTTGCREGSWTVRAILPGETVTTEVPCGRTGDGTGASGGGDLCGAPRRGVECQLGGGRRTAGGRGTGKVSHKGWPAITGILSIADHRGRTIGGTDLNDELLGGHGSDDLTGGAGDDVLWGDMWPKRNNHWQRDRLAGGPGDDFLYASHGRNVVTGGPGRDVIWAYFVHGRKNRISGGAGNDEIWEHSGGGTIDCGPGRDLVHTRLGRPFRLRGCERVKHYCAFGADGHGGCLTPGGKSVRGRR